MIFYETETIIEEMTGLKNDRETPNFVVVECLVFPKSNISDQLIFQLLLSINSNSLDSAPVGVGVFTRSYGDDW